MDIEVEVKRNNKNLTDQDIETLQLALATVQDQLTNKVISKIIYVPNKIINIITK